MKQVRARAWRGTVGAAARAAALLFTLPFAAQGCGTENGEGVGRVILGCDEACATVICDSGEVCDCGTCVSLGCVDEDGDGFGVGCEAGDDCNDDDAAVYPGRQETCNDIDDDCDRFIDEDSVCVPCAPACQPGDVFCNTPTTYSFCDDSTGCPRISAGVPCPAGDICEEGEGCIEACRDLDGDGYGVDCLTAQVEDCDDENSAAFPGNPEVCDGIDNNCDFRTDEGFVCDEPCTDECDAEGLSCSIDGAAVLSCRRGPGGCLQVRTSSCPEGTACQGGTCSATPVCFDPDGDRFGPACVDDDCRPYDAAAYPGAVERCNGIDDNCDGIPDGGSACTPCNDARAFTIAVGEALYEATCGGITEVEITGVRAGEPLIVLLGAGDADAPAFSLGTGTGGSFASLAASGPLGAAQVAQVVPDEGGALTVRFTADSNPFVITAATSGVDALEPNNAPVIATALGAMPTAGGTALPANDLDFLLVEPGLGNVLVVESAAAEGRTTFPRIWSGNTEVSWPFSTDTGTWARTTHFRVDAPGRWVVGLRNGVASEASPVAWRIREIVPPTCNDDAGDPVGAPHDDTFATARAFSGTARGTLCPGDYDVFTLGALDNTSLDIVLDADPGVGFLLFRNGFGSIRYNSFAAEGGNTVTVSISDPGTYYVMVLGEAPLTRGAYTLTL